jgi:threonine aldolase
VLAGVQPQPLDFEPDGTLNLDRVAAAIKPVDPHFARTSLLCLENTQAGKVLPLEYLVAARQLADRKGLSLHLDGARLFNAVIKLGVTPATIAASFDSVNICLSKGLGAPVGSVLCGSTPLIAEARRWRKVAGGGMRQAGFLAAAGIHALENHVERLADDHENAMLLAKGLSGIDALEVDMSQVQTNMVFAKLVKGDPVALEQHLRERGVTIRSGSIIRLVTHMDIQRSDIERAVAGFCSFFAN